MSGRPQKLEDLKKKESASNVSDNIYVKDLIMAAVEKGYYFNKPTGETEKLQSKPLTPERVDACKQLLEPLSSHVTGEGVPPVISVTPLNKSSKTQQIMINLSSLPLKKDYQKTGIADWVDRHSSLQERQKRVTDASPETRLRPTPVGAPTPKQPVPRIGVPVLPKQPVPQRVRAPIPKPTPVEQQPDLNTPFSSAGFLQQEKTHDTKTDTYTVTYIKAPENKSVSPGVPGSVSSLPFGYVPQEVKYDPRTRKYTLTLGRASPTIRPGNSLSPLYDPVTGTYSAIIPSTYGGIIRGQVTENKQPARGVGVSGRFAPPYKPPVSIIQPPQSVPRALTPPSSSAVPQQPVLSTRPLIPNSISRGSSAPLPGKPKQVSVYGSNVLAPGQEVVAHATPELRPGSRGGEPSPLAIGGTPEPLEPPHNQRMPSNFFPPPPIPERNPPKSSRTPSKFPPLPPLPPLPNNRRPDNKGMDIVSSELLVQDQALEDEESELPMQELEEDEEKESKKPFRWVTDEELKQNPYKDMKYVPSAPYIPPSPNVKISNFFTRQFLTEERAIQLSKAHRQQLRRNEGERLKQIKELLKEEKIRTENIKNQILAGQQQGAVSKEKAHQLLAEENARTESITNKLKKEDLECIRLLLTSPAEELISQGGANTNLKLFSLIEQGDFKKIQELLPIPEPLPDKKKTFFSFSLFSPAKAPIPDYWQHGISAFTYATLLLYISNKIDPDNKNLRYRRDIFQRLAEIAPVEAFKQANFLFPILEPEDQAFIKKLQPTPKIIPDEDTPLMHAIKYRNIELVQSMLRRNPGSINERRNSLNALDYCILYSANLAMFDTVLEDGVYNPQSGITIADMDRALLLSEAGGDREVQICISKAYGIMSKRFLTPDGEEIPPPVAPGGSTY